MPDQPNPSGADHDRTAAVGAAAGDRPAPRTRTRTTRTKARKRALDILFESDLRSRRPTETLAERSADADPPVRDYTAALVRGVEANQSSIDQRIRDHLATGWTLDRLPRVDRAAIRIAVYEIDHIDTVPDAVAASEATDLVGELSTDESPAFVSGLLGSIVSSKTEQPD